uniref:Thioredoxin-like fold domain-containing protein n=1 Tax=Chromera velia CCMP2878 TaxID=1169474 RepID=A0A0G4GV12_9ALVE|mmetsp:Transcript_49844/g.98240  ORF Transcript_49844/g.98240 Transcript_49844/m.98240 type:complete len:638 (+) Transcript_49844:171-2084(+)|eukprot:Cvel_5250.t1-p1 / transcript=Cvel_5250.t1 / gene=Cvel_5250 / organism=Chromera_velia_CCMP2878 / gene_product=Nucleoredoxin, putative / transcript_product=Nucleoredoxin, putative / location=Cvel_scaffold242:29230-35664(+) / protein_length=637 / sequence_SO=supercontig / SO=protein_coding / is_pseudo=false
MRALRPHTQRVPFTALLFIALIAGGHVVALAAKTSEAPSAPPRVFPGPLWKNSFTEAPEPEAEPEPDPHSNPLAPLRGLMQRLRLPRLPSVSSLIDSDRLQRVKKGSAVAVLCVFVGLALHRVYGIVRDWWRVRRWSRRRGVFSDLLGHVLIKRVPLGDGRKRREGGKQKKRRHKTEIVSTLEATKGKTVALFFHGRWAETKMRENGWASPVAAVSSLYRKSVEAGRDLEIVWVWTDARAEDAESLFEEVSPPFASLPFSNSRKERDKRAALARRFQVSRAPALVVLDSRGRVLNDHAYLQALGMEKEGDVAEKFPWTVDPVDDLLGSEFVDRFGETRGAEALKGKVIGLYFAAKWNPLCAPFSAKLAEVYSHANERGGRFSFGAARALKGKRFEVILVSGDESEALFWEHMGAGEGMPWLAVPFQDKKRRALLQNQFSVQGLPALVLLDENRKLISLDGRRLVETDPDGFPWRPPAVRDPAASELSDLADRPAVIVFHEDAEGPEGEAEMKALLELAGDPEVSDRFAFVRASVPSERADVLRELCGLSKATVRTGAEGESGAESGWREGDTEREANEYDDFGEDQGGGPTLVILDLRDHCCYVADSKDVSVEGVRAFLSAYSKGKLRRRRLADSVS